MIFIDSYGFYVFKMMPKILKMFSIYIFPVNPMFSSCSLLEHNCEQLSRLAGQEPHHVVICDGVRGRPGLPGGTGAHSMAQSRKRCHFKSVVSISIGFMYVKNICSNVFCKSIWTKILLLKYFANSCPQNYCYKGWDYFHSILELLNTCNDYIWKVIFPMGRMLKEMFYK